MGLLNKLKNTFRRSAIERDASDELAWHLEQRTREYIDAGMSAEAACAEARKQLGNVTLIEEDTSDSDLFVWLESLKREVFLAFRMLWRAPIVTAVAAISLALGIGANTVVFTLMKQVVLDYLPVPNPEQLVILHSQRPEEGHTSSNGMDSSFSYPLYRDLDAATHNIFQGILAFYSINASFAAATDATETVHGELVSGNFFRVLRVAPWRGRLFTASDDQTPGGNPIIVLGYGFWKQKFGSDPAVLNRTIRLNSRPYVVVGVAPPQFYGTDVSYRADIFVPMCMKTDVVPTNYKLTDRLDHWASLIGRLQPGVTAQQAAAALNVLYPHLRDQDLAYMKSPSAEFKTNFAKKRIELTPGGKGFAGLRDQLSNPLRILMVMVGIVLFITVINVANLLVARCVARQREMAIRLSIGAGKAMLSRQLIIESLVLAALGGCAGVLIAYSCTPVLLRLLSFDLSSASISAHPDWRVLLIAAGVTFAAGFAFGLLPAWQSTRTDVASSLKNENSYGHTGGSVWLRRTLVVGQIALSLMLVTAAILFTRSLQNLKNVNVGFNTTHLIKFAVNPLQAGYSLPRIKSFGENLRQQLAALPGIESAAIATVPVLEDDDEGGDVTVEGATVLSGEEETRNHALRNFVSPGYFSTMQIPLIAGRQFRPSDLDASNVAIVNQTFVNHFLPGKNLVGMHFGRGSGRAKLDQTIIGVVADSKHSTIREQVKPFTYFPYLASDRLAALTFYVRTRSADEAVMPEIRALVHHVDSSLPINDLSSMSAVIDESLFVERSLGFLSIGFALLATLLAIVGLYGVMAYSVTRRYRELGIRMAIGASPKLVLSMVLRESIYLGIVGVLCAIPCVIASASYVRSALYGVQPNSPSSWLAAAALLLTVALLAGFVPAWNAARIDPHAALRVE
ncbi:MAG TPA: ABC transporter permease [Bryobacteraceae bacterium]|nr:ABC transporter permease [Bryobacteraceae bacterium]